MKLGVTLASLHLDIRDAIARASTLGLKGLEIEATRGEITYELSHTGRRDLLHHSKSCGMEIAALSGYFGPEEEGLEQLFEKIKKLIGLAVDLRAPVVTTLIGKIPVDARNRERNRLQEILHELGMRAENVERVLAIHIGETGLEELKKFILELNTPGIRIAYDPSVMVTRGLDPVKGVKELRGLIAHAYARDISRGIRGFSEAVPGEGAVPFREYILALCETGYAGYHIIKREAREGRIEDISRAKEFLERLLII